MSERIRVLICEDHALFREGLRAVLREHARLEVVGEAAQGREAVEAALRLRPDVVLMDIEMPEMSGLEATRRIVEAGPGVKVLVLTLYDDEEVIASCLDAGASGYVLKDGPAAQLVYAIEAVQQGKRYLSPGALTKVVEYGRSKPTRTAYDLLTGREREVLKLLADGLTTSDSTQADPGAGASVRHGLHPGDTSSVTPAKLRPRVQGIPESVFRPSPIVTSRSAS